MAVFLKMTHANVVPSAPKKTQEFSDKSKPQAIRDSNIVAAKGIFKYFFVNFVAVADAIRTSLGPRGMDKMVSLLNYTSYLSECLGHKLTF